MRVRIVGVLLLWVSASWLPARAGERRSGVFEVRARATSSMFYKDGRAARNVPGDEVVYLVDLQQRTITRTAFYNRSLDASMGGGLQTDQTTYTIVHEGLDPISGLRVIKAFGRTARTDGYELLVIGERFVESSRSTGDYFVLHHYDRLDGQQAVD
jgi:hypothetical protein